MAETSSSLQVDAGSDAVLDVIADLERYPAWNGEIKSVEVLEQTADGRPARARFSLTSSGMSDEYVLAYAWAPDGVSWQLEAPSTLQKKQVGAYRLTPSGSGTDVRYELEIAAKVPMIGPMRRKIEKRIVDGALQQLKKRVESLG